VVSYGAAGRGKAVLRVRLESPNQPTVRLAFYPPRGGDDQPGYAVVRQGLPVVFHVRAAPVDRLRRLVSTPD
jgi:hypothetical protein